MIPGQHVDCIMGWARIRHFQVATTVMKGKVMTYVNQVAEIVHGLADEFHGAACMNTGDTFLVIWSTTNLDIDERKKMADMAVLAAVRIFGAVHSSATLAQYRTHPGLQQRRLLRVALSFGLHYGWAIEGAVGTEFKIDASYLSPNVHVTQTVERASQVYDVAIMITQALTTICSKEMSEECRLVDCVAIQGYKKPLGLHVMDLSWLFVAVQPPLPNLRWNSRERFRCRQRLDNEKRAKLSEYLEIITLFRDSSETSAMRAPYTKEFKQIFDMGYQNFSEGEWAVACKFLRKTRTMLGFVDGPSATLLEYMAKPFEFECPQDWKGVHALDGSGQPGPPVAYEGGRGKKNVGTTPRGRSAANSKLRNLAFASPSQANTLRWPEPEKDHDYNGDITPPLSNTGAATPSLLHNGDVTPPLLTNGDLTPTLSHNGSWTPPLLKDSQISYFERMVDADGIAHL
jgi:class 3 adenylate cyclase